MPATEHFFRDQKQTHVVFAVSSVFLLVSIVVMMIQDQTDKWREYQKTGYKLSAAAKAGDIEALRTDDYKNQYSELTTQQSTIEKSINDGYADLKNELSDQRDKAKRVLEQLEFDLKSKKAYVDEAKAVRDLQIRDEFPTDEAYSKYLKEQVEADRLQLEVEAAQAEFEKIGDPEQEQDPQRKRQLAELADLQKKLKDVTGAIDKLTADEKLIQAAMLKDQPEDLIPKLKRWSMGLPIMDGFNSQYRIQQDWIPQLSQPLGMTSIARFDRCRTCHMNAEKTLPGNRMAFPHGTPVGDDPHDWVKEGKFPHPFATHPNPDLFVTSSSPHSVSKYGCTICHEGQGSGTSFGDAEHTPNDPHLQAQWEEEYGYHPNHFWEYPMQPDRFRESTCIKCHHDVVELGQHPEFGASAPKVFRGFELIQKYGCFGCHEIHGTDGGVAIGPDLRLEPQTEADAIRIANDPKQVAGRYRKVGPSLRHIAAKLNPDFIAHWTKNPSEFRPTTKMPQFFGLSNQEGEDAAAYEAVELQGIAQFLTGLSEHIDLLSPADDYEPDAERGKTLFAQKGCLSCHTHAAIPGAGDDKAPNISDIHRKVKRNADDSDFSDWLYTWIRDPSRYHERTTMGQLFYDVYTGDEAPEGADPVADIVAFLLSQGPAESFETTEPEDQAIDSLVELFLRKSRFRKSQVDEMLASGSFPKKKADVKGDEAALATEDGSATSDPAEWRRKKLDYIGRRSVSRYGCYGCHNIPGYEEARPIGVALHDWGRKDTSKLGLEHIEEFLHHHGEPADSEFKSTIERVKSAIAGADGGGVASRWFDDAEEEERELSAAYFYDSLLHHGRPGFIWQKLRDPRSYDYETTQTKQYDELLRMPKFPLQEDEVEAIATFVLGLVADPPAEDYIYQPDERAKNRIEGEFLLAKYNCTSCHMVELPEVTFAVDVENDIFATEMTPADHPKALDLLLKMRPPRQALTGESSTFTIDEEALELPNASFLGLPMIYPDPEEEDPEFREYGFDVYETLDFGEGDDKKRVLPSGRLTIPEMKLLELTDGRGGKFANWLVDQLVETTTDGNRQLAWQASPPILHQEGVKVQTPWLYQFLLEPETIRHTTVLRMPKFNMSPQEARTLANYFAAVDGAPFPYQEEQSTDRDYLLQKQNTLADQGFLAADEPYLHEGWKSLNGTLCIKCHSVGSRTFKASDPKTDIRGPDLNRAQHRLRGDWVRLWVYNPKWIIPTTSMPLNFPHNASPFPELLGGDPEAQVDATVDALMNYGRLLESPGPVVYTPKTPPAADAAPDAAQANPQKRAPDAKQQASADATSAN